jgi:hypothetical protein
MDQDMNHITAIRNQLFTKANTFIYTRKQAIEEGAFIDVTKRYPDITSAIYKCNCCVTDRVWEIVEKSADNPKTASSRRGILWDMMFMSRYGIIERDKACHTFGMLINGIPEQEEFDFKAIVGPGDEGEVVVTIMMPWED